MLALFSMTKTVGRLCFDLSFLFKSCDMPNTLIDYKAAGTAAKGHLIRPIFQLLQLVFLAEFILRCVVPSCIHVFVIANMVVTQKS